MSDDTPEKYAVKKPSGGKKAKKEAGRPPVDQTKEDKEREEAAKQRAKDREAILLNLQAAGYPITDEAIADALVMFFEAQREVEQNVGRPSKYDPRLCEWVEWLGSRGYSLKQICSMIGISNETMYAWMGNFPEFSESVARARDAAQTWWEVMGQAGLASKSFNFNLWNKIVSNRFRRDYTDRKGIAYDPSEPETFVEQGSVLQLDPRDLTEEQRKVLRIAIAMAEKKETE